MPDQQMHNQLTCRLACRLRIVCTKREQNDGIAHNLSMQFLDHDIFIFSLPWVTHAFNSTTRTISLALSVRVTLFTPS
jgi:hypothetical protein